MGKSNTAGKRDRTDNEGCGGNIIYLKRRASNGFTQFFSSGFPQPRWDLELKDRYGLAIESREWFPMPQPTIREAIDRFI